MNLEEEECKVYFKQLLEGLKHCHDANICHSIFIIFKGDISANNVLFSDKDDKVKLADFGFSKEQDSNSLTKSFLGTNYYYAPEVESSIYSGFKADCWSLGVILYEMITSNVPFKICLCYSKFKEYQDYCKWVIERDKYIII